MMRPVILNQELYLLTLDCLHHKLHVRFPGKKEEKDLIEYRKLTISCKKRGESHGGRDKKTALFYRRRVEGIQNKEVYELL